MGSFRSEIPNKLKWIAVIFPQWSPILCGGRYALAFCWNYEDFSVLGKGLFSSKEKIQSDIGYI